MPVINLVFPPAPNDPTEEGPCFWPVDTTCVGNWASYTPTVQAAASSWATYILWALTGRRFGACQIIVRPCGPKCQGPNGYLTFPVNSGSTSGAGMPWMVPWIDAGIWRNCGCAGGCTCAARCEVKLVGPVVEVESVTVDGIVLSESAYRLDWVGGTATLVRTDGLCWPECQDMNVGITETGSFAITYRRGISVPPSGQIAAGMLAGEFAKSCVGADCALPAQLASLTRNGVQVDVMDPATFIDNGLTGVAMVDMWIRAVNPARKAQRSRVYSSDVPGQRVTL